MTNARREKKFKRYQWTVVREIICVYIFRVCGVKFNRFSVAIQSERWSAIAEIAENRCRMCPVMFYIPESTMVHQRLDISGWPNR